MVCFSVSKCVFREALPETKPSCNTDCKPIANVRGEVTVENKVFKKRDILINIAKRLKKSNYRALLEPGQKKSSNSLNNPILASTAKSIRVYSNHEKYYSSGAPFENICQHKRYLNNSPFKQEMKPDLKVDWKTESLLCCPTSTYCNKCRKQLPTKAEIKFLQETIKRLDVQGDGGVYFPSQTQEARIQEKTHSFKTMI